MSNPAQQMTGSTQILDVKQTIVQNKRMIQSMATQLRQLEEQIQRLEDENASLLQANSQKDYQIGQFTTENQDLADQLNRQQQQHYALEKENARAAAENRSLVDQIQRLEQCKQTAGEQERQISTLQDQNYELQQQLQAAQRQYANSQQNAAQVTQKVEQMQASAEKSAQALAELRAQAQTTISERDLALKNAETLQTQLQNAEKQLQQVSEQLAVAVQQRQLKEDQILQLDSDFEKLTKKLAEAEFTIKKHEKVDAKIAEKDAAAVELTRQIQQLTAAAQTQQSQCQQLGQQLTALNSTSQAQLAEKNQKIQQLAALNQQLLAEKRDLQTKIDELGSRADAELLRQEFGKQVGEMQQKIADLQASNKQAAQAIQQLQAMKQQYELLKEQHAQLKGEHLLMLQELDAIQTNIVDEHRMLRNHSLGGDEGRQSGLERSFQRPAGADSIAAFQSSQGSPAQRNALKEQLTQSQQLQLLVQQSQAKDEQINSLKQYNANVQNNIVGQIEELKMTQTQLDRQDKREMTDYQLSLRGQPEPTQISPQLRKSSSRNASPIVPRVSQISVQQAQPTSVSLGTSQSQADIFPRPSQIYNIFNNFEISDLKRLIRLVEQPEMQHFIEQVIAMTVDEVVANWTVSNEILIKQELLNYFQQKRAPVKRKSMAKLYESDLNDDGFLVFCMGMLFFTLARGSVYRNGDKVVFEVQSLKVLIVEE